MGLTAVAFVMERIGGQWDRSTVAGVTPLDYIFGSMLTQSVVITAQVAGMFVVAFWIFHLDNKGSVVLAFFTVLLQGLCGMAHGLLVGGICNREYTAIMMVVGFFYPCIVLTGCIWPMEVLPSYLKYVSYCLPQTYSALSVRDIINRGLGLSHLNVILGFCVSIVWLCIFVVTSTFVYKFKH
ncbi:hypothetical protein CHUAL_006182 [Chamberlinius hualienensis]